MEVLQELSSKCLKITNDYTQAVEHKFNDQHSQVYLQLISLKVHTEKS